MKVLAICARRYNGHELWTALGVLQEAGIDFDVASTSKTIADELTRQPNTIELLIDDIEDLEGYDGLMFVSGDMSDTESYWHDKTVLSLVQKASDMPVAAICCSVPTIRYLARDKRVSFFPLVRSRMLLEEAGADLQSVSISVDGNLVTAEHQMATQSWAALFVKVLKGEEADPGLHDSGFVPEGKAERKLHPRLERLRDTIGYHPANVKLMEEYYDSRPDLDK